MLSDRIVRRLRKIVGKDALLTGHVALQAYRYDASLEMAMPDAVVLPQYAQQVSQLVRLATQEGIPYLPRGSGTNLSGGSIAVRGGIVIELSRMNRILKIDLGNHRVLLEPGVYNLELQDRLARQGFFYPPDPASQRVSTLGGNIAENSGGPHCLKYGVTTNHILGLEAVLPSGEIVEVGGEALQQPGYDLVGLLVGSEGTLAVVTKAWLRILPLPEAVKSFLTVFDSIESAAESVTSIIKAGILPAAMEMMDRPIIHAVEDSVHAGYPRDAEAVLIIDLDGPSEEIPFQEEAIKEICLRHGAREVRIALGKAERDGIWAGRRGAFGAVARITPNYLVTDCTVPRTQLPFILSKIAQISRKVSLPIGNVFHAGDGNLHPLILFDDRSPEERQRAHAAGREIMEICASVGGTISGEHGIGLEKREAMSLLFSREDMDAMRQVKKAFDPAGFLNPGKIFPEDKPEEAPAVKEVLPAAHQLEKELLNLLGPERVRIPVEGHEDWTVGGIIPRVVVHPETEDEISEAVRAAAAFKAAIVPRGSGSKTMRMGLPERADVLLSLKGLDSIKTLDAENFVATVRAGMSYASLQSELRRQGLWLPLQPFYASEATVGGVAATNDSGFPNPHLNALRDLVLGMTVITADGRRAHFGGVTVKNVAGYDMCKLFLGSHGTLGIITDITLKLAPAPEEEAALLIVTENLQEAIERCAKFFGVCDVDSALELMNWECARQVFQAAGLEEVAERHCHPGHWLLILHTAGRSSLFEARLGRYKGLLEGGVAKLSEVVKGHHAEALKLARSGFFRDGPEGLALQVSTTPMLIEEVLQTSLELARAHSRRVKIASAPANGMVCLLFTRGDSEVSEEEVYKLAVDVKDRYRRTGCSYHLEHAPLTVLRRVETWHNRSRGVAMMKRLKQTFDPLNLFNPGKLISLH